MVQLVMWLLKEQAMQALRYYYLKKRSLGGVCLNEGCIPSKALLNSAKIYDYAVNGSKYGVNVEGASLIIKKVIERKGRVVDMLVGGVGAR